MGHSQLLTGHVASLSRGIQDRELTSSSGQLANVNPTFQWVRLAQRIPVRVSIDEAPADVRLITGRTATLTVLPAAPDAARPAAASAQQARP